MNVVLQRALTQRRKGAKKFLENAVLMVVVGCLSVLVGCSSVSIPAQTPVPTVQPAAQTPTPTAPPMPPEVLETLDPAAANFETGKLYRINVNTVRLPDAVLQLIDPETRETLVSYNLELGTQYAADLAELAEADRDDAFAWAMPNILYALHTQIASWTHPYSVVRGHAMLTPDRGTLAVSLCNESGGRGQYCNYTRLWFFDLAGGTYRQADFNASGLLNGYPVAFAPDSLSLTMQGCLNYKYPTFGYCGDVGAAAWDVQSGDLLSVEVVPPTPTNNGS